MCKKLMRNKKMQKTTIYDFLFIENSNFFSQISTSISISLLSEHNKHAGYTLNQNNIPNKLIYLCERERRDRSANRYNIVNGKVH